MTATPLLFALCAAAQGCFPPPRREIETGRGLAGALLLQGALAGRLELYADRVRLTGPGGTGDPALDDALAQLGRSARQRDPADWVERLGPGHWPGCTRDQSCARAALPRTWR
ncbi:GPP34 family phosphoprotein [Streptomyces sp. NPDC005283]|uniref:GPP34 family phosphoprotein n=1 Tax=Streptomyces sp. NPDC005283 TaxID=3156871 RepID=UPI0034531988